MESIKLRPTDSRRDFKPLIDAILDGWYQSPTEKFNDPERFYSEAEALLQALIKNLSQEAR